MHSMPLETASQRPNGFGQETEPAERMMMAEGLTANIIPVELPAALTEVIRENRRYYEIVLIDPNMANRVGRGFPVDWFLSELM